jgi:hypothetical protein
MTKTELKKLKTEELRQMAKDKGVEDVDSLERAELIDALYVDGRETKPASEDAPVKSEADEPEEEEETEEESPLLSEGSVEEYKNPAVGSKAETMKRLLVAQPKVTIMIPLEGREPMGSTQSVTLNGYRLNITKGKYVKVPQQVAEVIMKSQRMTQEAINNYFLLDAQGISRAMRDKLQGPAPSVSRG